MADRSKIIEENPIGNGLDAFRASFRLVCEGASVSCTPDALERLGREDLQNIALNLLYALRNLPTIQFLQSGTGRGTLRSDLLKLNSALSSDDFDFDRIKPLLKSAIDHDDDARIWYQVYHAVTESTPPPRPIASSLQQTPWLHSTSSFQNSSEYRRDVDNVLKLELGTPYIGLRDFHKTFFGGIAGLEATSEVVFKKCMEGNKPLFGSEGWSEWRAGAEEKDVLAWFGGIIPRLELFAKGYTSISTSQRKLLAQPRTPLPGSKGKRSMDIGFVNNDFPNNPETESDFRHCWSHILVPGELKSNPAADKLSIAWIDLATYAREVLSAQDTRRFTLGFTLCGSLMRIWEFDRLGWIASEPFDINEDGLRFVSTILGFLWMNEEELGFDPTIMTANGERSIEIERDGSRERLIIDRVMQRAPRCIAGRATTCWKAHREGHPQTPLVIKDSWQYLERDEEGELLREVTDRGVVNVARYYHHEIVQICGTDDDIRNNVRGGLDITRATNYRLERSIPPPSTIASGASRKGRSSSAAGKKRSSSQTGAPLPLSKRSCSTSPTKAASSSALRNRVHRRIILRDYGMPIYKASSRAALLAALEGCIEGHESLHKAGILHRDISINNLMINEDSDNPSWPSFLIDLDLAIKERRDGVSGAQGKTGTRAFMAIGALLGEQHSFMHDLESFFWVLFWICIHYDGPNGERVVPQFDKWNHIPDTEELAKLKLGTVSDEDIFTKTAAEYFTSYYQPLIPWLTRLRRVVFPNGGKWKEEDDRLYPRMKEILREAQNDLKLQ